MTLKEIQLKLYEKLKASGWGDKLKMFILSDEFGSILKTLHENSQNEKRFTPVIKDLFRAFEECNYRDLKVVMISQDPYPTANIADGIAFSCSNDIEIPVTLKYMFSEIERTVYPLTPYEWNTDLKRWSNQGVLMLNMALTCEIGKMGSHLDLWKPFLQSVLDMLNTYNTGIIYVFMGTKAKEMHKSITVNNYKLFTTHPLTAHYQKSKQWDSGNVFNNVNKILKGNTGETITW